MPEVIRVDYHCHPNLPLFLPVLRRGLCWLKARWLWHALARHQLSAVVLSEHAYKHPKKSYELMCKTKPANAQTEIFPGVEYLTKEGTDIIVFAVEPEIVFGYLKLLKPRKLTLEEVVALVEADENLQAIVAHPYTLGSSGIVGNHGLEITKEVIARLGRMEAHNCSFTVLAKIFSSLGLDKIMPETFVTMQKAANAPAELVVEAKNITGGSDAHHPWEVGDYMKVALAGEKNREQIYQALVNNQEDNFVFRLGKSWFGLLIIFFTVERESFIKKSRLYTTDKPAGGEYLNYFAEGERAAMKKFSYARTWLLQPLLKFLDRAGVSPDVVTLAGVLVMIGFVYFLPQQIGYAMLFVVLHVFLDALDGSLARYQKISSDRGALLDIGADQAVILIGVLASIFYGLVNPFWAALYVVSYILMIVFMVLLNRLNQPVAFVLRTKYWFFIILFIDLWLGTNFIFWFLMLASLYMLGFSLYLFNRLRSSV